MRAWLHDRVPTVSVKVNEGTTWRILVWCRKILARDNPRLSADELRERILTRAMHLGIAELQDEILRTHPGVKPHSDGTHEGP